MDLIDDPVSRRNFMKIMSASFALAGLGDRLSPAGAQDSAALQNAGELCARQTTVLCYVDAYPPNGFAVGGEITMAARLRLRATVSIPTATAAPTSTRRRRC